MKLVTLCLFALACTPAVLSVPSPIQNALHPIVKPGSISSTGTVAHHQIGGHEVRDEATTDTLVLATIETEKIAVFALACPRHSCPIRGIHLNKAHVIVLCYTTIDTTTVGGDPGWARIIDYTGHTYVPMTYLNYEGAIFGCVD